MKANLLRVTLRDPLPAGADANTFPFSLPVVRTLETLDLSAPVTLFVGENGSGKSTLLEAIASAAELTALGADRVVDDDSLAPQRALGSALRLAWSQRSRKGFFLRAEDFFGYLKLQARTDARIAREWREQPGDNTPHTTEDGRHVDEREAARYLARYDARSHGESFLDLFSTRLHPGGLYLLDEPEAPLSPARQLALLSLVMGAAKAGAQFVIATHSPILLACPGATIYSFDAAPVARVAYADLEHVSLMRGFLNDPERYLRHLG